MKNVVVAVGVIGGIVLLIVTVSFGRLAWMKYFMPKEESVRREAFEETKSYTHGKMQDLAKYYEEYTKAETSEDKEAIRNIIRMRFADFNSGSVNPNRLRAFLVEMRGY